MNLVEALIQNVAIARSQYIAAITSITELEAQWKKSDEQWNIIDITEHLFWAEQGALYGMWKTLFAIREGKMNKTYDSIHKNLPIEDIIAKTWQPKEQVPAVATPRLGGTLAFWKYSLNSLQSILETFGNEIKEDELRLQAHPHPISGAMDFQQRIEFLAFHIDRHKQQVLEIIIDYSSKQPL